MIQVKIPEGKGFLDYIYIYHYVDYIHGTCFSHHFFEGDHLGHLA